MDKERFLQSGLLEQYVLGLTSEEENKEVERYARAFPEIRREIDLMHNAVRQYAEEQLATPSLKKSRKETASSLAPVRNSKLPAASWLMAACLALFGIFGIYQYAQKEVIRQEVNRLNLDFTTLKSSCEQQQQALHDLERQIAFFQHHLTDPLQLTGTTLAPESSVRVYWNEQHRTALLQVLSLPHQPRTKQYQVWADIDGKMINLGLIDHEQSAKPQKIRCLPKASSLNITLEPFGGSEEPHVDQLYANVNL